MGKRIASVTDLTPDPQNANRGTERGRGMLESSLRKYGAGRSVLADKHGTLIAGNKTVEAAAELGLTIRTVQTDGTELVVVQRTDLDLSEGTAARELAYADNRVGQVSLEWELAQIGADVEAGIDLAGLFSADELAALLTTVDDDVWAGALGALPDGDKPPFEQMTFTVNTEQAETIRAALARAKHDGPFVDSGNENSNGNALARVCEAYVG